MSSVEILKDIRRTEDKAEEIRKQAIEKARLIVRQGEEEAAGFIDQAVKAASEEGQKLMESMEEQANREIELLNQKNREECMKIKAVAEKNLPKAVDFVLGRIVKNYGYH